MPVAMGKKMLGGCFDVSASYNGVLVCSLVVC